MESLFNLANLYYVQNKNLNAEKYFALSIENGNKMALETLEKITSKIKLYFILKKITNKNILINTKIDLLEFEQEIINYNKLNNQMNNKS